MPRHMRISLIGILLAIAYWPLEAAMHAWVFGNGSFFDKLFSSEAHELWMRCMISLILISFGFLAQRMLTRQEEIQALLQRKRDRLQQVIDNAYDAYVAMDSRGVIIGWNRSAEEMFGWDLQDALGRSLADTIVPEEFREAHSKGMQKYLETGVGPWLYKPVNTEAMRKDGTRIRVEMSVVPLLREGEHEFFSFIRLCPEQVTRV